MAPVKVEKKKRRNKRKSRTEVSSPSSSDDESVSASAKSAQPQDRANGDEADLDGAELNEGPAAVVVPEKKVVQDPEKAFEDFYLRQATKEFANDLDKLRSAGDFNDQSVALLIRGLKAGVACFSPEERARIGKAAGK